MEGGSLPLRDSCDESDHVPLLLTLLRPPIDYWYCCLNCRSKNGQKDVLLDDETASGLSCTGSFEFVKGTERSADDAPHASVFVAAEGSYFLPLHSDLLCCDFVAVRCGGG